MNRRPIKKIDITKFGHLLNVGCQNKGCPIHGNKFCKGDKLNCKYYQPPNLFELTFHTKCKE